MVKEREVSLALNLIETRALQMKLPKSDDTEEFFHTRMWNLLIDHELAWDMKTNLEAGYDVVLTFCAYALRYWNSPFDKGKIVNIVKSKKGLGIGELKHLILCGLATTTRVKPFETLAYYLMFCNKKKIKTEDIYFYG